MDYLEEQDLQEQVEAAYLAQEVEQQPLLLGEVSSEEEPQVEHHQEEGSSEEQATLHRQAEACLEAIRALLLLEVVFLAQRHLPPLEEQEVCSEGLVEEVEVAFLEGLLRQRQLEEDSLEAPQEEVLQEDYLVQQVAPLEGYSEEQLQVLKLVVVYSEHLPA